MKAELLRDRLHFARPDQAIVRHRDRMQRAVELVAPEGEELLQFRKGGCQIVILPDVILQQAGMVGQMVENVGGGEAVSFELAAERNGNHGDFSKASAATPLQR